MRKKSVLLILIGIAISISFCFAEEIPIYRGMIHGNELFNNIDYTDIGSSSQKNEIYRLSALGIIQGRNGSTFDPTRNCTRDESLFFLVRLLGQEEAAQKAGENLVIDPDDKINKRYLPTQYWAEGYIEIAKNLGILDLNEENDYINFPDSIKNDIDGEVQSGIRSYERSGKYTEQELQTIEDQIRRSIEWREAYSKPVTREEFATWLSRTLKLEPIYAKEQQTIRNLNDFQTIKTVFLPYVETIYQKGIMRGFPDNSFKPDHLITRNQVAMVIDKVKDSVLEEQGYKISYGYIQDIDKNNQFNSHLNSEEKVFLVKDENGIVVRWDTTNVERPEEGRDFIVLKNGSISLSNIIKVNDYYKYYINPQDEIVYAEMPNEPQIVSGKIFRTYEVDNENGKLKYIQIITEEGSKEDYLVSNFAHIRVNDKYGDYYDLINDLEVKIKHFGGIAEEVLGNVTVENPDYILPYSRVYVGKLLSVKDSFFEVITDEGLRTFQLDNQVNVIKKDLQVPIESCKEGDLLRVEFNEINLNKPNRIYILDQSQEMDKFYKGFLERVDSTQRKIVVSSVKPYNYLGYGDQKPMDNFSIKRETVYRTLGETLDVNKLKQYQGREIYFWTDEYFGKDIIQSVVVKEGFERSYLDDIKQISQGKKTINLSDVQLTFGDSTVFVKDGRIVDSRVLKEGDEIFVLSHNKDFISFASVESMPIPNYTVYRGKLSDISTYRIKILNDLYGLLKLQNNSWKKVKGFVEFPFSDETVIWDNRNYNSSQINIKDFLEEKYLKSVNSKYIDSSIYAIIFNDEVIGIQLVDAQALTAQFGVGEIVEINPNSGEVKFDKIQNWNSYAKNFISQNTTIDLKLDQCVIAKDGKIISLQELNVGDKLYFSRKDNNVYYALVY